MKLFNYLIIFVALAIIPTVSADLQIGTRGTIGIDLNLNPLDINYGGNYSINTNNSQYLQGYTPTTLRSFFQLTYDTLYCELTGCTMQGNINANFNNITNIATIDNVSHIIFDTTHEPEDEAPGTLVHNIEDDTLEYWTENGQVIQFGREVSGLGKNNQGNYLQDGSVVALSGYQGDNILFIAADGNNISRSSLVGVLTSECAIDEVCPVTVFGWVRDVDTSAWNSGDMLWIDPTEPGNLTNVKPNLPNNPIVVGYVGVVHANIGTIFSYPNFNPTDGFLAENGWFSGNLTVAENLNVTGTISAPGNDNEILFNDGGTIGSDSDFKWDGSRLYLSGFPGTTRIYPTAGGLEFEFPDVSGIDWRMDSTYIKPSVEGAWLAGAEQVLPTQVMMGPNILDPHTGIGAPGPDQLSIKTGGSDAIIFDSSQNTEIINDLTVDGYLGIGTSSPEAKLHAYSSDGAVGILGESENSYAVSTLISHSDTAWQGNFIIGKRSGGNKTSPTVGTTGQTVFTLDAQVWHDDIDGVGGEGWTRGGQIIGQIDGDVTYNGGTWDAPFKWEFRVADTSGNVLVPLKIDSTGNVFFSNDNEKTLWGAGNDASIYYDGTDMVINPKEVGTGIVKIDSDVNITSGDLYVNGDLGLGIYPQSVVDRTFHVHGATSSEIRLTSDTSGYTSTDGFFMQLWNDDFYLWNAENTSIILGTNNDEKARLTQNGDLGLGIENTQGYKLYSYNDDNNDYVSNVFVADLADSTNAHQGALIQLKNTPTANTAQVHFALNSRTDLYGTYNSTGDWIGGLYTTNQNGNGVMSYATGVAGRVVALNGTITNGYAVRAYEGDYGSGTIENLYGVYIDSMSRGTNSWGVYQSDENDSNYFAGNVSIGNDKYLILEDTDVENSSISFYNPTAVNNFAQLAAYPSEGTNVGTALQVIPKGTGFNSNIKSQISVFNTDLVADGTNYEAIVLRAAGSKYTIQTARGGTGQDLPIWFGSSANPDIIIIDPVNDSVNVTEDLIFTGSGSGVPYGKIYASEVYDTITISAANESNKVQITSFTVNGTSNLITPSDVTDDLTIQKTGVYHFDCIINADSVAGLGATFGLSIFKNNGNSTIDNAHGHIEFAGGGGEIKTLTLSGQADLTAGDTIEVWVWNYDNSQDVVIDDITLSLNMIGG